MNEDRGILIFTEVCGGQVHRVSYELINKARSLANGEPVECLVLAEEGVSLEELAFRGADRVYYMKDSCFSKPEEGLFAENIVRFVKEHKPSMILTGATNFGRSLAPRVAAALKTGLTADCTDLKLDDDGALIQIRPAFSDNILAHIKTAARPQMATVRYKEFNEAPRDESRRLDLVECEAYRKENPLVEILEIFNEEDFDIANAEVVVAGGRGIKRKEDLEMLSRLAELMGGVLGVSRALVDAGMIGSAHQVGYSGNRVKPKLYVACGISGAPQHLAGMKEAEKIIAINSDPSAPIFSICDYGYVGDLYEIVPKLIQAVSQRKAEKGKAVN